MNKADEHKARKVRKLWPLTMYKLVISVMAVGAVLLMRIFPEYAMWIGLGAFIGIMVFFGIVNMTS